MTKSKYLAKKAEADGIQFASKKERDRYLFLKSQERQGLISDLQMQVPFVLIPAQYEEVRTYTPKTHRKKIVKKLLEKSLVYKCDFCYAKDGKVIVEDVKGYRNSTAYAIFVIKRKLMLFVYGIKVIEVQDAQDNRKPICRFDIHSWFWEGTWIFNSRSLQVSTPSTKCEIVWKAS